jgi:phosphatidylglycerol---prolipoprotein diacylglyceryl transferase
MHPTLFQVGSFKIASFGAMMVVAFIASLAIGRKRAIRYGISPDQLSDIAFWAIIGGIFGARLFFIVQDWSYYAKNINQLLTLQFQGLTSFGGFIVGGLVAKFADAAAPGFIVGHAIGRIGCLLNGCCHGKPATSAFPFTVYSAENHTANVPAQLYDSAMNLVAFALIVWLEKRSPKPGYVVGLGFFFHGITRFIYEFFRAGASSTTIGSSPFTEGHVVALLVSLFGLFLVLRPTKIVRTAIQSEEATA